MSISVVFVTIILFKIMTHENQKQNKNRGDLTQVPSFPNGRDQNNHDQEALDEQG